LRFFFDASVSRRIAGVIRTLADPLHRHDIVTLDEYFNGDASIEDPVWLPELGAHSDDPFTVISIDQFRQKAVRSAWRAANLTTFWLRNFGEKRTEAQAGWLLIHWPNIERHAQSCRRGDHFFVHFDSKKIEPLDRR
jgi:hypothetical protein